MVNEPVQSAARVYEPEPESARTIAPPLLKVRVVVSVPLPLNTSLPTAANGTEPGEKPVTVYP